MVWMQAACVEALCLIFGLPLISHRLTGFPAFILVAIQASLESRTAHPSVVLQDHLPWSRLEKGVELSDRRGGVSQLAAFALGRWAG